MPYYGYTPTSSSSSSYLTGRIDFSSSRSPVYHLGGIYVPTCTSPIFGYHSTSSHSTSFSSHSQTPKVPIFYSQGGQYIKKYTPSLSVISENVPPKRNMPRSYIPPYTITSPATSTRMTLIDTDSIDVSNPTPPNKKTAKPGEIKRDEGYGTLRRGRTVVRIRTKNLKENPYAQKEEAEEEVIMAKKTAGEKLKEKFLIQSKRKKSVSHRTSVRDLRKQQEKLQKNIQERLAALGYPEELPTMPSPLQRKSTRRFTIKVVDNIQSAVQQELLGEETLEICDLEGPKIVRKGTVVEAVRLVEEVLQEEVSVGPPPILSECPQQKEDEARSRIEDEARSMNTGRKLQKKVESKKVVQADTEFRPPKMNSGEVATLKLNKPKLIQLDQVKNAPFSAKVSSFPFKGASKEAVIEPVVPSKICNLKNEPKKEPKEISKIVMKASNLEENMGLKKGVPEKIMPVENKLPEKTTPEKISPEIKKISYLKPKIPPILGQMAEQKPNIPSPIKNTQLKDFPTSSSNHPDQNQKIPPILGQKPIFPSTIKNTLKSTEFSPCSSNRPVPTRPDQNKKIPVVQKQILPNIPQSKTPSEQSISAKLPEKNQDLKLEQSIPTQLPEKTQDIKLESCGLKKANFFGQFPQKNPTKVKKLTVKAKDPQEPNPASLELEKSEEKSEEKDLFFKKTTNKKLSVSSNTSSGFYEDGPASPLDDLNMLRESNREGSTSSTSSSSSTLSASSGSSRVTATEEEDTTDDDGGVEESPPCPAKDRPKYRKYTINDFQFLKVLGKGSFGKVMLAELKGHSDSRSFFAIKCLKKDVVLEDDDVEATMIERKVLLIGSKHPYLCHLLCTFQTESHLFFTMEYLNGGDLMFHIQQSGRFPEDRARFYAAEVVSGLKFLHKKGIIYRDLKLDNVLLDYEGHIRIADFGMCKLQIYLDRTADTFCGTPDYMAPEIIKGLRYNQSVDFWAFGILLYEMLIGNSPFSGADEDELFWSVCNEPVHYPRFLSKEAKRIIELLLEKDAWKRLGSADCSAGDIANQSFFSPIDWERLEARELEPPFRPKLRHPLDVQYFDVAFTKEHARLTPIDREILRTMDQSQFFDFSYTNPITTD